MKFQRALLVLFLTPAILIAQELAPGTVIPVMLKDTITSRDVHAGVEVHTRVMQDVVVGGHVAVRAGAALNGEVTRLDRDAQKGTTQISIRFDQVDTKSERFPVVTSLRSLASYVEVEQAQIPPTGTSRTVPYEASTFVLVGGDVSYRGGGPVMHGRENVGKPNGDGVLVRVFPNSDRGCTTPLDSNPELQSLWVFSSNACGIYGLSKLTVVDRGLNSGEFTLTSQEGGIELHSGDGLLLTAIAPTR